MICSSKSEHQSGFSVVELIVAIVAGALFIIAISFAVDNYIHLGQRGRNLTVANAFSEAKIEALRNTGYNGLTVGASDITSELPAQLSPPKSAQLDISQPQLGLAQIDLTVTFNDNGVNRTYSYKTYIGELGVGQ